MARLLELNDMSSPKGAYPRFGKGTQSGEIYIKLSRTGNWFSLCYGGTVKDGSPMVKELCRGATFTIEV